MPSATQARVRTPTPVSSLQEQVEHMHFHEAPARCKSPCCAPLAIPEQASPFQRPALVRNASSHHTDRSAKSMHSTGTDGSSYLQSDDGNINLSDYPEVVDMNVFEQILEMDDDEEREFSKTLVFDFFEQASGTLSQMKDKLNEGDLNELSALGHFLKGSSATLGLVKLQRSCEKIQNYGKKKDATGNVDVPDASRCLRNIAGSLRDADSEFVEAKQIMDVFFGGADS